MESVLKGSGRALRGQPPGLQRAPPRGLPFGAVGPGAAVRARMAAVFSFLRGLLWRGSPRSRRKKRDGAGSAVLPRGRSEVRVPGRAALGAGGRLFLPYCCRPVLVTPWALARRALRLAKFLPHWVTLLVVAFPLQMPPFRPVNLPLSEPF